MQKTIIIGVPIDLGAENLGVDIGPSAFRYQGIEEKLNKAGLDIEDLGDIKVNKHDILEVGSPRLRYLDEIVRVNKELAALISKCISDGQKVIVLGGDHSLNLGAFAGASLALEREIGLIYLDAHGDMNTSETTLSGNIHGMHLAALMGYGDHRLTNINNTLPSLRQENLLHIGGSDWDEAELKLVKQQNLATFSLNDLLTSNLSGLILMIDQLNKKVSSLWVSLDLDVIDQVYAPGAGMPNPKGLTYREIAFIAEYIGKNCNVVGLDMVEYNPLNDQNNRTAELGIELIAKLLGKDYSWYTSYMSRNRINR